MPRLPADSRNWPARPRAAGVSDRSAAAAVALLNRCVGVAPLWGLGVYLAVLGGVDEDLTPVGGRLAWAVHRCHRR
jgi:hypothetical protein